MTIVKFIGTIKMLGEIWQLLNFNSGREGLPKGKDLMNAHGSFGHLVRLGRVR